MKKGVYYAFLILAGFLFTVRSFATHIRAGEIIAELIDCQSRTYRFSLIGYTDTGSSVLYGGGDMDFGDGSAPITFEVGSPDFFQDLGDEVALNIFYATHTFPANGTYTIRYREFNRNGGVANMDNSVNTPFYIETQIVIDPLFGCNNTPVLLNPPLDRACVGKAFYHNPGGWDVDGDSLSYEIVVNKQDINTPVANYKLPHIHDIQEVPGVTNEERTGPPTYVLDPVLGDLSWDAPGQEGEYNIAFIIKEWRYFPQLGQYLQMGYVTRDMQILIEECENERPEVMIPDDTCVVAGTLLEEVITAVDQDGHRITIESFGGPYELKSSPATYSPLPNDPVNPQIPPAIVDFLWQTNCSHVQNRPYQVTFKAKDFPDRLEGPSLVDFKTWEITVIGPPPEGLAAERLLGRRVSLSWDDYSCGDFSEKMQIWRRVDSYDFTPDHCETGMPPYAGYTLIDQVPIGQTDYIDIGGSQGLAYGATYCYRLVAVFQTPGGGESYVSDEICVTIEEDVDRFGPVITKVSVEDTDISNGIINLEWYSPFEADTALFPPPFSYEIFQFNNQSGTGAASGPIATTDTTFVNTGLNTDRNELSYRIVAYDANGQVVDTSATASSVLLSGIPGVSSIELIWGGNTPWSNRSQDFPYHYIFRDHIDTQDETRIVLIDSIDVNVNGFHYIDSGQVNGVKLDENTFYQYYVTTQGTYGNAAIYEPLVNKSQILILQPNDTIVPCLPIVVKDTLVNSEDCYAFVRDQPCNIDRYYHDFIWTVNWEDAEESCKIHVIGFEVWFSPDCSEEGYELIDIANDFTEASGGNREYYYKHDNLSSYKGCYRVRAVDRSGNAGEFSPVIPFDNCPYYELPNVFTPNNDGFNDMFQAFDFPYDKCPRFVKEVEFKVFNRWGKEIFTFTSRGENSILINWDGKTNDGTIITNGVYFYKANVQFDAIDPALRSIEYNGWIHVMY